MGLDSVEMVFAFEEEFGIEIPEEDAFRIITVGDMYNFVRRQIVELPPGECLSRRVFYQLRRALMQNYGLQRHLIRKDTILTDLITPKEIEEGWPFLEMYMDLEAPKFRPARGIPVGLVHNTALLTVKHVVDNLIQVNFQKLVPESPDDNQIWNRCVDVVVRQLNVDRHEVRKEAEFARDLGMD